MSDIPTPIGSSDNAESSADVRRMLELQLAKIRNEASAARLDARAAEIEMMLRRLRDGSRSVDDMVTTVGGSTEQTARPSSSIVHSAHSSIERPDPQSLRPSTPSSATRFASWGDVRAAQVQYTTSSPRIAARHSVDSAPRRSATITRSDAGDSSLKRPYLLDLEKPIDSEKSASDVQPKAAAEKRALLKSDPAPIPAKSLVLADGSRSRVRVTTPVMIDANQEIDEDEHEGRGKRPAAWLFSAAAHVAVLILLAGIGLNTRMPKDQIAFSASAASANEESIETFEIEQSEAMPESEVSEPVPSETEYEISPVGELAATEFSPDAPPSPPTAMAAAMSSAASSAASAMSMKSMSTKKMEFCGVEGGGNHFVYLVDSSGSMGDGFESARAALLSSIELLTPDQRYYVVFFDADSDYIRLADANKDEPRSVFATPENKAATKRWAMRINKDRGKAPYDALRFALSLKPDVIFLLSDGEFPQGIEDLLKEENNVTNLFGESKPISIVHTISYYSEEGESRMRRIAKQNMGQYRYVPKP